MILFYHTLTGNDSGKRKKVLLTAAPASAPCSRRRRRSPPLQIPLRRKKTSTRMCSSSRPGRHSYTWDPRAKQQPTGLIAYGAAHRRPVQIPPLRTAVTLVDIPTGWDPRTNQKPTGLLIAPPAAWPVLFQIPLRRKKTSTRMCTGLFWSEQRDLNPRPPRPERGALPTALCPENTAAS